MISRQEYFSAAAAAAGTGGMWDWLWSDVRLQETMRPAETETEAAAEAARRAQLSIWG